MRRQGIPSRADRMTEPAVRQERASLSLSPDVERRERRDVTPLRRNLVAVGSISAAAIGREPSQRTRDLDAHGSDKRVIERSTTISLPEDRKLSSRERALRVAVTIPVALGLLSLAYGAASSLASGALSIAPAVATTFGIVALGYFVATVLYALRYRATPLVPRSALPRLTVIVPAFNEGAMVRISIESALESGYPKDRLEILAIDDGSTDDTWSHIEAAAKLAPDVVVAIKQPKNGGKREALRTGFERATGELVVTVDSDSKIERGALEAIVAPMLRDDEVAAVAGRVLVLNREEGLIPRLLSARFYLTFDLARAAQSRFGAVLCTPGALSAYRKSAVDEVLERWSSQTFFGAPCTIAEDRALTTWLLRSGHRSVYQRNAVVRTVVPTDVVRAARMLIRWERGNIREDIVLLPLLFTKWRPRDRFWPALEVAVELLQYPFAWLAIGTLAVHALGSPVVLAVALGTIVLGALAQNLYCLRSPTLREFGFGTAYSVLAAVGLWWVFPYSLATVRDGRWLTR